MQIQGEIECLVLEAEASRDHDRALDCLDAGRIDVRLRAGGSGGMYVIRR